MVFTCENHLQLARFFFPLLHFFSMSWDGRYRGPVKYSNGSLTFGFPSKSCISWVCTRGSWFSHVKTMTQLADNFFSTTSFFFHELRWEIPGVCTIQQWVFIFLILFYELHKLGLYLGFMLFTWENHDSACTYFFSTTPYSLHELEWEILGVRKIQQWVFIFLIPCYELHKLSLYQGSWFSHVTTMIQLADYFFSTTCFFFHEVGW